MKVYLRKKELKDGSYSLYLDYYIKGEGREREYLGIRITGKGNESKEKLALGETLARQKELELLSSGSGMTPSHKKKINLIQYFRDHIKNSARKRTTLLDCTLRQLILYAGDKVPASIVDEKFCQGFRNHLSKHLSGETPHAYFCVFKQVLNAMVAEKIFSYSPALKVRNPMPPSHILRKEVLNMDEIITLNNTYLLNKEIKRSFLFSCFTGVRCSDIRSLKWKMIDFKNKQIFLRQTKTGSKYIVHLNDTALTLLGAEGPPEGFIFKLPSQVAISAALKTWTTRADIKKHITFHCARHSYASTVMAMGANEYITSKLLGHTSTRQTHKYAHVAEEMKRKAVDALPKLF